MVFTACVVFSFLIFFSRDPCDGDDKARSSTLCLQLVSRRLGSVDFAACVDSPCSLACTSLGSVWHTYPLIRSTCSDMWLVLAERFPPVINRFTQTFFLQHYLSLH